MKKIVYSLILFLLITQICFGQWTQVGLNDEVIKDIAVQNQNIFAITSDSGKVFRSIDNGGNWTMIIDSCARDVEISLTGKVFVVMDSSLTFWIPQSLFSSMDNGATWSQVNILEQIQDSIPGGDWIDRGYNRITISPTGSVFCNIKWSVRRWTDQDCIAQSNDDGITWSTPGMGVVGGRLFDFKDQSWVTIGHYSTRYGGDLNGEYIHLSTDNGNTWNYLGQAQGPSGKMPQVKVVGVFSNDKIITGGLGYDSTGFPTIPAIMISTDMCSTWTKVSSLNCQVGLSVSDGSTEGMLVGTDSLGVFLFSDEGDSLGSKNEGLTNLNIHTLALGNNGYVYAGTDDGVWRRPLIEIISSVDNEPTQTTEFILEQNYPNPFNPSTVISYQLSVSGDVTLKVFDILGNEIATLVNEYKSAGKYEVEFNASALPSGVYFYLLKARDYKSTKKMILLK